MNYFMISICCPTFAILHENLLVAFHMRVYLLEKGPFYPRIWNRLSSLHNHQDVYYINKLLFMRVGKEERNNSVKSFQKK